MKRLTWWMGALLALCWQAAWASGSPAGAADGANTANALQRLPPAVQRPLRVRLAVRVLDVLQVQETSGQARMALETTQQWNDPRLRFDTVKAGRGRIDRIGEEARQFLRSIWTPGMVVDNQTGDKTSATLAVSTLANGDVTVVESYESLFRVQLDMRAFPFDRQQLGLSFSLPRYAAHEVLLVSTEAERQLSGLSTTLSASDWRAEALSFAHTQVTGWNASSFSRLLVSVGVERISEGYLLRIFIPIVAVLLVSVFVLWVPTLSMTDKGNLIFSSLLALAAISFTFEASFPGSISLNTPVAQMISLGYLYLVAILLLDSILSARRESGSPYVLTTRWHLRWLAPISMGVVRAVPF